MHIVNTGTLRIHGEEFIVDTIYLKGLKHTHYAMFSVRPAGQDKGVTFASEKGFIDWLDAMQSPRQQALC
jgi:hypothetical protein